MVKTERFLYRLMFTFYILAMLCLGATCSAIKRCPFGQYWSTLLQECQPCSDVCEPPTRLPCSDFCPDLYIHLMLKTSINTALKSNNNTTTTSTTSTKEPVTTEKIPSDEQSQFSLIFAISAFFLLVVFPLILFLTYHAYTNKRNALRHKREDTENGNGQHGIELQPLNGTAGRQRHDAAVVDQSGDGNRQSNTPEKWIGMTVYDKEHQCLRVEGLDSLSTEGAQQPDSLEID